MKIVMMNGQEQDVQHVPAQQRVRGDLHPAEFSVDGFKLDRTSQGEGIIIFIRENISHKVLEKISSEIDEE